MSETIADRLSLALRRLERIALSSSTPKAVSEDLVAVLAAARDGGRSWRQIAAADKLAAALISDGPSVAGHDRSYECAVCNTWSTGAPMHTDECALAAYIASKETS